MIFDHIASRTEVPSGSPSANAFSRRRFVQVGAAAGGGLVLSVSLPLVGGKTEAADTDGFAPNAFVRIGNDGKIVLTMSYVEMGQGTYTSIPMLIAEELEVDLQQVQLEHAPPNAKLYGNPLLGGLQATGNSNAVRAAWQPLRQAGAIARSMLVAAAAKRWNVDPASCQTQGVPGQDSVRPGHIGHLGEHLAAQSMTDLAERGSLSVGELQPPFQLRPEDPIFGGQIFVPRQQLLVHHPP